MSYEATEKAWAIVPELTEAEALVFLRLAYRVPNGGAECWPGIPRLIAETGMSQATVYRALDGLEKKNRLKVDGYWTTKRVYTLDFSQSENSQLERKVSQSERKVSQSENANRNSVIEPVNEPTPPTPPKSGGTRSRRKRAGLTRLEQAEGLNGDDHELRMARMVNGLKSVK